MTKNEANDLVFYLLFSTQVQVSCVGFKIVTFLYVIAKYRFAVLWQSPGREPLYLIRCPFPAIPTLRSE